MRKKNILNSITLALSFSMILSNTNLIHATDVAIEEDTTIKEETAIKEEVSKPKKEETIVKEKTEEKIIENDTPVKSKDKIVKKSVSLSDYKINKYNAIIIKNQSDSKLTLDVVDKISLEYKDIIDSASDFDKLTYTIEHNGVEIINKTNISAIKDKIDLSLLNDGEYTVVLNGESDSNTQYKVGEINVNLVNINAGISIDTKLNPSSIQLSSNKNNSVTKWSISKGTNVIKTGTQNQIPENVINSLSEGKYTITNKSSILTKYNNQVSDTTKKTIEIVDPNPTISIDNTLNPTSIKATKKLQDSTLSWSIKNVSDDKVVSSGTGDSITSQNIVSLTDGDFKVDFEEKAPKKGKTKKASKKITKKKAPAKKKVITTPKPVVPKAPIKKKTTKKKTVRKENKKLDEPKKVKPSVNAPKTTNIVSNLLPDSNKDGFTFNFAYVLGILSIMFTIALIRIRRR